MGLFYLIALTYPLYLVNCRTFLQQSPHKENFEPYEALYKDFEKSWLNADVDTDTSILEKVKEIQLISRNFLQVPLAFQSLLP